MARQRERCDRCSDRRIKCDKAWPSCTACKRDNAVCSGPPRHKFVYVNRSSQQTQSQSLPIIPKTGAVQRRPKTHATAAGSTFSTFSLAQRPARRVPATYSDTVAEVAINILETSAPKTKRFLLSSGWLHLIPARVCRSSALRDCVNLYFSTWTNYQRGLPCDQVTDPKIFGKALKSVQKAVNSGELSVELVAAVSMLDRHEIMFDARRQNRQTSHRQGMTMLMKLKGAPSQNDELDLRLRADNYVIKMIERFKKGENKHTVLREETDQLHFAVENTPTMPFLEKQVYHLLSYLKPHILLDDSVRSIRSLPASESRAAQAVTLLQRTTELAHEITNHVSPVIDNLFASGIISVTTNNTPVGQRYHFTDPQASVYLVNSTRNHIVLTRTMKILHYLISGSIPAELERRNKELCRRIWMQLPYVREEGQMHAVLWLESFLVAYECAEGEVKQYLIDWIKEVGEYRGKTKGSAEEVDNMLLRLGKIQAGDTSE